MHACMSVSAAALMWRSEDNLWELVFSFYHVDPGNQTQDFRLSSYHCDPLSHHAGPNFTLEIRSLINFLNVLCHSFCQLDRLKNTCKKNGGQSSLLQLLGPSLVSMVTCGHSTAGPTVVIGSSVKFKGKDTVKLSRNSNSYFETGQQKWARVHTHTHTRDGLFST